MSTCGHVWSTPVDERESFAVLYVDEHGDEITECCRACFVRVFGAQPKDPPPVEVYIDSDPSTLGADATSADLDRYAQALAEHLASRFGRTIEVVQVLGGRSERCPDDVAVSEYVQELEAGDGWCALAWGA